MDLGWLSDGPFEEVLNAFTEIKEKHQSLDKCSLHQILDIKSLNFLIAQGSHRQDLRRLLPQEESQNQNQEPAEHGKDQLQDSQTSIC